MKALHVFYGDDFAGGASYSMASIAVGLAEKGYESHALIPRTKAKKMRDYLQENGVIVHEAFIPWLIYDGTNKSFFYRIKRCIKAVLYRFFFIPFTERSIERIIQENEIDIVHIGGAVISSGYSAAKRNSCKLVWHIREFVQEDHSLEFLSLISPYDKMRDADMLICVSNAVRDKMHAICPDTPMVTIYNGVDTTVFYPSLREGRQPFPVRIMSSSGISETKGTFATVEAVKMVSELYPLVYDIFGLATKEDVERLKRISSENGLDESIFYKGLATSIADEYRKHDIQIVASRCEAFGRVTAEPMLCKCLVVGADSGGTSELLGEGRGFLFEPGNSESLATAVIAAIENGDENEVVRDKAYDFAKDELDLEQYVGAIEGVYLQLLEDENA